MRIAALDLGTNTFLCLIAEISAGRLVRVLRDEYRIVRLGEGVNQTRTLAPQALKRAELCLKEFRELIDEIKVDKVVAVATSAARDATNSDAFFEIGRRLGIPIEIIDGEREAGLTFLGLASDRADRRGLVGVDIGGGSTELVRLNEAGKVEGQSFNVGVVRLHEMFVKSDPPLLTELEALEAFAKERLSPFQSAPSREVIAVAGTPTTLAAIQQKIDFDESRIHGFVLTKAAVIEMEGRLAPLTTAARGRIKGLEPGRADVILPGAIILRVCMDLLKVDKVTVSARGIRYGLALSGAES